MDPIVFKTLWKHAVKTTLKLYYSDKRADPETNPAAVLHLRRLELIHSKNSKDIDYKACWLELMAFVERYGNQGKSNMLAQIETKILSQLEPGADIKPPLQSNTKVKASEVE